MTKEIETIFPVCHSLLLETIADIAAEEFISYLQQSPELYQAHPYLADLARIELAMHQVKENRSELSEQLEKKIVHPDLDLLEVAWQGLPDLLNGHEISPSPGKGYIIVVPGREKGAITVREASNYDLLALKIIAEGSEISVAADEAGVSIGLIDNIIYGACEKGYILSPPSKLVRPQGFSPDADENPLCTTSSFTLQWHITQACNLHCRHCYDRTDRKMMTLDQGVRVLDQLFAFCQEHNVYGQVTFTGGNPLLYPHFLSLYQGAVDRGFLTGVLGNPMEITLVKKMVEIQRPEFYQVSLEGLQEHNDYIRGDGHFEQTLRFLDQLKALDIYSMVMLTLTDANMDQVLPLAELLRTKADLFTYNRLALVGEGAGLASVPPEKYQSFLEEYIAASKANPIMGLKDSLCNLHLFEKGEPLKGGCAGVGCGAAFNFISLLPDGEVHSCRKLPSLLGNLYESSLSEIYHSTLAEKYRMGSSACDGCEIRSACGGCPAVSQGFGLDVFTDLDPYCFKK